MSEWVVTGGKEVVNAALPVASSVPVPKGVVPSLNVTVPVGTPVPGDTVVTVAVKVTDWPNTDGLTEEATEEVVEAWLTVCVRGMALFAARLALPLKLPLVVWLRTAIEVVVYRALPVASRATVVRMVAPSLNVTVPVGIPPPVAVTVAVKVTDWPNTDGLTEEVMTEVVLAWPTV